MAGEPGIGGDEEGEDDACRETGAQQLACHTFTTPGLWQLPHYSSPASVVSCICSTKGGEMNFGVDWRGWGQAGLWGQDSGWTGLDRNLFFPGQEQTHFPRLRQTRASTPPALTLHCSHCLPALLCLTIHLSSIPLPYPFCSSLSKLHFWDDDDGHRRPYLPVTWAKRLKTPAYYWDNG